MPLFRKRREGPDAEATRVGVRVQPPIASTELAPGTEVSGYRVEEVVGRGGMGVVYRAVHLHLGREVALKLLAPGLAGGFRERFVRESRIAASLSHPNIVTVYDAGEARGVLWIAMELVHGTDLRRRLADEQQLEPHEVVRIASQVASALDAAHAAGLVHRDVKPGNILLSDGHAWLTDFGLTKRLESRTDLTAKNDIVGTPDYLAPETIEGRPSDGRADQYALGCVVHHALTGSPPYEGESDIAVLQAHLTGMPPRASDRRAGLPVAADDVLARALARDPAERYATASEFALALATALGAEDAAAPDPREQPPVPIAVAVAEPSTQAVIRAALTRGPVELSELSDGEALLAAVRDRAPGLVLVDATLPGPPLDESLRRLRSATTERIPVIALVERGRDDQWRSALAAGADDVLLRPFSAFQLLAKVRDHAPRALTR